MHATLTSPGDGPARRDLYRFFDADARLLYVGISLNAAARASQHSKTKPWWGEVAMMTVEHFENSTRKDLERAEAAVIRLEQPVHNVTHSQWAKRRRTAVVSTTKGWPLAVLPTGSPVEVKRGRELVRATVGTKRDGLVELWLDDEDGATREVVESTRATYLGHDAGQWLSHARAAYERRTAA